jgi:hypothetical protein
LVMLRRRRTSGCAEQQESENDPHRAHASFKPRYSVRGIPGANSSPRASVNEALSA